MPTTTRQTALKPRNLALEQLAQHQATVERWEAEQASKQAELDDLEARLGDEVLADETAADRLTASMQQLRDRVRAASSAAAAARSKVEDAKRAVVLAEAQEWARQPPSAGGRSGRTRPRSLPWWRSCRSLTASTTPQRRDCRRRTGCAETRIAPS